MAPFQLKSMPLSKSSQIVQDALRAKGVSIEVLELPANTHTAQAAADVIECDVKEIVKSLIFRGKESGAPILILASGVNRVKENKIKEYLGENIERADPYFVRDITGFAIGGIPPLGHKQPLRTFIDKDLLDYEVVWAAGGTPNTIFAVEAQQLPALTGGTIIAIY